MGVTSSKLVLLFISIFILLIHCSFASRVLVDGVTKWTNPTASIGDSIVFKHKYEYKLYIFQNSEAFKNCNFTRATLLTKPNSTSFTWHPSRPGLFYFSFNNGSTKPCQEGQKLAIKVSPSPAPPLKDTATSPKPSTLAPPGSFSSGGVASPPTYPWPFQPRDSVSPSPSQTEFLPTGPTSSPGKGHGLPFINSNPVVIFPAGEGDSATIGPVPTSQGQVVVGFLASQIALCIVTFLMLLQH